MRAIEGQRLTYLDRLRIVSIVLVMVLHVAAALWQYVPVSGGSFIALTLWNVLSHCCVPCLVMITGALMLSPTRTECIETLLKKRVLRMALVLLFWTAAYLLVMVLWRYATGLRGADLLDYVKFCLSRPMHLWYLYMLIGLYLVTPLLRPIAADTSLRRYFLILSFAFAILLPTFSRLPIETGFRLPSHSGLVSTVLGYTGYYMLGYALSTMELTRKRELLFYLLGIAGGAVSVVGTLHLSGRIGYAYTGFIEYLCLPQYLTAAAVFILFRRHCNAEAGRSLQLMNENSFGMYLVHVLFNEALIAVGLTATSFSPIISVPLLAGLIFILSLATTLILRKLPFMRRFL